MEDVIEVRDNGYPVSVTKDVVSAGTKPRSSISAGQITCDVQGAKVSGSTVLNAGGLVEYVATTLGDGTKLDASANRLDRARHSALHTRSAGRAMDFWPRKPPRDDAADRRKPWRYGRKRQRRSERCGSCNSPSVRRHAAPGRLQMVDGSFVPTGRPKIQGAVQLGGCRNWTPQGKSVLAASIATVSLPILEDEWTYSTATDAARSPTTAPEPVETLLVSETDLDAEAARRLALWKVPRTVFKFSAYAELLDLELGEQSRLTHPRLGLSSGAPAMVVGLDTDYVGGRVTVEVLV